MCILNYARCTTNYDAACAPRDCVVTVSRLVLVQEGTTSCECIPPEVKNLHVHTNAFTRFFCVCLCKI